jgi:small-conductance mechanosensitive channel
MRMFPIVHQAAIVMLLLGFYHFIIFWIDGLTGHGYTAWVRWLPIAVGGAAVAVDRRRWATRSRAARPERAREAAPAWPAATASRIITPNNGMFGRRVLAASFVITLLLAALFARLFYLQILRYDYFSRTLAGQPHPHRADPTAPRPDPRSQWRCRWR